jgi:hypothetical protein
MHRSSKDEPDRLIFEEKKRTWWAIVNMDRFVGLCNGDVLFSTEDPEGLDALPIDDLAWTQDGDPSDLQALIVDAPTLATPPTLTVGQMARECQVSHLAGRVIRHTTNPTSDPDFNAEEAVQLERTLQTILVLLIDEDLTFGRYCGALGICDRYVTTSFTGFTAGNYFLIGIAPSSRFMNSCSVAASSTAKNGREFLTVCKSYPSGPSHSQKLGMQIKKHFMSRLFRRFFRTVSIKPELCSIEYGN